MQTRFHGNSWWAYDPEHDSDTGPYSTEKQAQDWIDEIHPLKVRVKELEDFIEAEGRCLLVPSSE